MRRLVLLILLCGCAGAPAGSDLPIVPVAAPPITDPGALPDWAPGQSWTYRTLGYWDHPKQVTIVAVPTDDGHLLAATTTEELVDEIAWDRLYLGAMDAQHAPVGSQSRLLAFPMENGTEWSVHGVIVTAQMAQVEWVGGIEAGMRAMGEGILIEYAPGAGFVTRFEHRDADGLIAEGIELVAMGHATAWVSLERGEEIVYEGGPPRALAVADEDAVLAWALGPEGTRAAVLSPEGTTWSFEGRGWRGFTVMAWAASPGAWHITGHPNPQYWPYVQMHAVHWIEGSV